MGLLILSNNRSRESLVVLTLSAAFGTIKVSLLINNLWIIELIELLKLI